MTGRIRLRIAAILGVFCLSLAPHTASVAAGNHAAPRWTVQHTPTASTLNDVSCSTASQCMAVGANATIVGTKNGGETWSLISSGYGRTHPAAMFLAVRCPVPGVCFILAAPNIVLHTANFGRSWQAHAIPLNSNLAGVSRLACPLARVCYAIAPPSGGTFTWFTHSGAAFKTVNAGASWQTLPIPTRVLCPGDCSPPARVGYALQWISCQSERSCWMGGVTFIGSHEGYVGGTFRTDDGGRTWTLVDSQQFNIGTCPTIRVCTGIYYQPATPNTGPDFLRTTDGGTTWTFHLIKLTLTSVACAGSGFCELAGPGGTLAMAIGNRLFKQVSPTTSDLNAVACPRRRACYAVGAHGTIVARIAPSNPSRTA